MKETSWRTLMLLTTLLAVLVIFQGTVRSPQLPVAQAQPALAVRPLKDSNKPQDKPAHSQPQPVVTVAEARPVRLDDTREDRNETGWSLPPVPENRNETDRSSPPVPENLNETDRSLPSVPDDPNGPLPPVPE